MLLHTDGGDFTDQAVPRDLLDEMDAGGDVFDAGTLGGVYSGKYYTAGRRIDVDGSAGYLFCRQSHDGAGLLHHVTCW